MGKLDEIVIEEAQDQLQQTSYDDFKHPHNNEDNTSLLDVLDEPKIEIDENLLEAQVKLEINPLENFQNEEIEIKEEFSIPHDEPKEVIRQVMNEMLNDSSSDEEAVQKLSMYFRQIGEKKKTPDDQNKRDKILLTVREEHLNLSRALRKSRPPKPSTSRDFTEPIDITKLPGYEEAVKMKPRTVNRQPHHDIPELDKEIENLPETRQVKCSRCSKTISKYTYRQHTERVHFNIKNFTCDLCGRKFYQFSSLEQHMNQHLNLRPYSCPVDCGLMFTNENAAKTHYKIVHTSAEFVCEICAMKFKSRHKLRVR